MTTSVVPATPRLSRPAPLVESIFPSERVHLIAGASGTGKTTWEFPGLLAPIEEGRPIFNYPVITRSPWCYVSCDRSLEEVCETLERIDFPIHPSRMFEREHLGRDNIAPDAVDIIKAANAPVVVIEGLQSLVRNMNDYQEVSSLLRRMGTACKHYHRTVFATVHSNKTKPDERYPNPRERVSGSAAWGAYASTILLIERPHVDEPSNSERTITLLPRQAPDQVFYFELDRKGRFCPTESPSEQCKEFVLDTLLEKFPIGTPFETTDIADLALSRNVSLRTVQRWLTTKVKAGVLDNPKRGVFRRRSIN